MGALLCSSKASFVGSLYCLSSGRAVQSGTDNAFGFMLNDCILEKVTNCTISQSSDWGLE